MRLTTLLLLMGLLQVAAKSSSQVIQLSFTKAPVEQVFKEIERQSGYTFVYSNDVLGVMKNVSVEVRGDISAVMKEVCKEGLVTYKIMDKMVIVKVKSAEEKNLFFVIPVTGVVKDAEGKPLVGATVRVKGKSISTITDEQGRFILTANEGDVLSVSYIGFRNKEYKVAGNAAVTIVLERVEITMDTTVVQYSTGYQNIPKERATGSFVQLDNAAINRKVSTNILDRIYEITSGLNYEPRAAYGRTVTIRGNSTINANPRPLVVVDGFPYDESENFDNIISNINPNDVENITILKDAAAASIWGARAGNGVIVITTKKGRYNQDIKVSFTASANIQRKPDIYRIPTLTSKEVSEFEKQRFATGVYNEFDDSYPGFNSFPELSPVVEILLAQRRGAITKQQAEVQLAKFENHDVRDDINKYLRQTGLDQQYSLGFSGGTNKYNFYGSAGYDNNRSTNVRASNDRLTLRFSNTYKPVKNLELSGFLAYGQAMSKDNSVSISSFSPYTMLADEQGNPLAIPFNYRLGYVDTVTYPELLDWHYRPLEELAYGDNTEKSFDSRFGAEAKYTLIPGLTIGTKYQYQRSISNGISIIDVASYQARSYINTYMYKDEDGTIKYPIPIGGMIRKNESEMNSWNIRGDVNFDRTFNKHSITVIGGAEAREVKSISGSNQLFGYDPQTGTIVDNIDFATRFTMRPSGSKQGIPINNSINSTLYRYVSFFSNGAYTFNGKYTISGSARADGSNFFGVKTNQRIVPLWSVGGMWNISGEDFYNIGWLPGLKLRATYGYTANTDNGATAYATMSFLNGSSALNNFSQSGVINTPPNPLLRWEKTKIINIGVDFQSFANRLNGSVEYYIKRGIDLLGPILVDQTTGFPSFTGNRANMKGGGVDVTFNTQNLTGKLKWNTNFLFSYNYDEVTHYEALHSASAETYLGGSVIVGKPLSALFSYRWAGLDPLNGDPRGYVSNTIKDYNTVQSGNNTQPEDLVYHGTTTPLIFGSFINTFNYQNFSFSFNILYKFKYYFRRNTVQYGTMLANNNVNGHPDYRLRWEKPGDELFTQIPSAIMSSISSRDRFYSRTEILVEKGDHIRLQDMRVSYDFTRQIIPSLPFRQAQVFMTISDFGVLWSANRRNIDPLIGEMSASSYRNIAMGLNITF